MKGERIDLRTISLNDFIAYLVYRNIGYKRFIVRSQLNKSVTRIEPDHLRIKKRFFDTKSEKQIDQKKVDKFIFLNSKSKNRISKTHLIQIVDDCIQNMGTKGVYHPKRLKPKWNSLTENSEKLALFEKYVTNKNLLSVLKS